MNALSQAINERPSRPDPRHRLIAVIVGDEAITAECTVSGRYHAAVTQAEPDHCHPEEWPEIEVVRLWTADLTRDLTGLMEFGPIFAHVRERVEEEVGMNWPEPDPDVAYDAWRDRQMEDVP